MKALQKIPGALGDDLWRSWVYNFGTETEHDPNTYDAEFLLGFLSDVRRAYADNHAYDVRAKRNLPSHPGTSRPGTLAGPAGKRRRTAAACAHEARTRVLGHLRSIGMTEREAQELADAHDGDEEALLADLVQYNLQGSATPSQPAHLPQQQQDLAQARQPTAVLAGESRSSAEAAAPAAHRQDPAEQSTQSTQTALLGTDLGWVRTAMRLVVPVARLGGVPRLLHQSSGSWDSISEKGHAHIQRLREANPTWTYQFWSDKDIARVVKEDCEAQRALPKGITRTM